MRSAPFFIGLLLLVACSAHVPNGSHEEDSSHGNHGLGMHETYLVPDGIAAPEVSLQLLPDLKSGFNLRIQTRHFRFAPEHASQPHVDGEGHAHVYVDGVKISRVYGEWFYLQPLASGTHEVMVTLNTNDHRDYASVKGPIHATHTIVVP